MQLYFRAALASACSPRWRWPRLAPSANAMRPFGGTDAAVAGGTGLGLDMNDSHN